MWRVSLSGQIMVNPDIEASLAIRIRLLGPHCIVFLSSTTTIKNLALFEQVGQDRPEEVVHSFQGSHHTARLRSARRHERTQATLRACGGICWQSKTIRTWSIGVGEDPDDIATNQPWTRPVAHNTLLDRIPCFFNQPSKYYCLHGGWGVNR